MLKQVKLRGAKSYMNVAMWSNSTPLFAVM
jgi:hypothetical protein